MRYLNYALPCMLALLTAACNSNDDNPPVPLQYRISWIHSEDSYQLYEYDNEGRIAKWEYNEPGPDLTVSCSSSFTYPADGTSIAIVAEETRGDMALDFNETLHLNADGTASRAEGTVLLKRGDSLMRKNYTAAFEYNHLHQLTEIEITEKRVDTATGSEETYPLEWAISLEWSENNLTGYSEYTDPEYPAVTKAYTYFGGAVPYHMPVVQGPILRAYYLPLQYQGILGRLSEGMVKEMEYTSRDLHLVSAFSYSAAVSANNSFVESYSIMQGGKETEYTIGWDTKKNNNLWNDLNR